MDQSMMPSQEMRRKSVNSNHETPLNRPDKGLKTAKVSKRYERVARIFELIDTLPESTRIDILKKLVSTNITKVLRGLVIDLSNRALQTLHEELEESSLGMRAHPRKECILTADYCYEDQPYCDFVKDISEGGAFVYSQVDFETEDEIELSFYFPNRGLPIKFTGEVVRSTENGVGIKFIKQNNYQKDILKSFVNELN